MSEHQHPHQHKAADSHCHSEPQQHDHCALEGTEDGCHDSCHDPSKPDYLLWGSLIAIVWLYGHYALSEETTRFVHWYGVLTQSVFELANTVWWGVLTGMLMIALLSRVPREYVMSVLGTRSGFVGVIRATAAGLLLDLCNHGILMVGAKLYERGASIGQVMAFLVASPWNSFSLTLVLIALIGLPWTLAFIALSMIIAVITGVIFDRLTANGVLPSNPNRTALPDDFHFWRAARKGLADTRYDLRFFASLAVDGVRESRMIMRWILFGIVLAGLVRAFVSPEYFADWFGPTLAGLGLTIVAATIIEVCSEGSTPIAADLLTRANAPGNSFAFLMAGAATDYTEIMVIRETTRSWRIALFLPLIAVPQVILVAWLVNLATT